jgi:adenylylsulfate kinase
MSWAIWITGRPGSGKTTLATRVAEALLTWPVTVKVLDLAAARRSIVGRAWASEAEEELIHRALAYTAKLLTEAGVAVVLDATAPRRAWRDAAREWITHFAEVQLVCPPELCVAREQATRWALGGAAAGGAASMVPDVALDYEESLHAELRLHTHVPDLLNTVEEVLLLARRLHRAATATVTPSERTLT